MTSIFLISFILPLILSVLLTPWVIRLAPLVNAIDQPDKRKVHKNPIPRLGGLAVAASFLISGAFLLFFFHPFLPASTGLVQQFDESIIYSLGLCAALLIFFLGVWDDIEALKPGIKFLIQFIAATIAYLAGFKISILSDPFGTGYFSLEWLSYPLTIIWIVGITNAFNLIDGLDGLASGTALIALASMGAITFFYGQIEIVLITLVLGGAILGFLWYNFRPARVFLGDSGSLFIGFLLALLSIQSFTKIPTSFALLVPIFALGLPIMDTFLSMTRRFLSWFLPEKYAASRDLSFKQILSSIFQPDKSHVHHQILQKGLSHKHTVLLLYLVSAFFGAGAIAIALTTQLDTIIFTLIFLAGITITGINKLKYKEIALLHNGIFLNFYNKLLINRHNFQKVLDCFFIIIAFICAYILTQNIDSTRILEATIPRIEVSVILFTCVLQFSIFWLSGLYKETIQQIGIADVFRITKSVALAAIISTAGVHITPFWEIENVFTLLIFNFYFLATLVLGLRIMFHLLKHLFRRSRQGTSKVLIYGAGEQGMLALQRLLTTYSGIYTPLGFLDEDPNMEGKLMNGYQIYGGHWKLERLIREHRIDYLFIATDHLKTEVQQRILKLAQEYGIKIKMCSLQIREVPLLSNKTLKQPKKEILYAN